MQSLGLVKDRSLELVKDCLKGFDVNHISRSSFLVNLDYLTFYDQVQINFLVTLINYFILQIYPAYYLEIFGNK